MSTSRERVRELHGLVEVPDGICRLSRVEVENHVGPGLLERHRMKRVRRRVLYGQQELLPCVSCSVCYGDLYGQHYLNQDVGLNSA